jgi:hypothetical protein
LTKLWRSQRFYGVALFVAMVTGASCIDPSGPKDWVCTRADTLAVTVTSGLKPRISWTPQCTAFLLAIFDSAAMDDESPVWAVVSRDTVSSQVPASLNYGSFPPNTLDVLPASPLQTGRAYEVFVAVRLGDVIGHTYFTP